MSTRPPRPGDPLVRAGQKCPRCGRLLAAGAPCPEHGFPGGRPVLELDHPARRPAPAPTRTTTRRGPRKVCPDGGGRCSDACDLAEGCPGPVDAPRAEKGRRR